MSTIPSDNKPQMAYKGQSSGVFILFICLIMVIMTLHIVNTFFIESESLSWQKTIVICISIITCFWIIQSSIHNYFKILFIERETDQKLAITSQLRNNNIESQNNNLLNQMKQEISELERKLNSMPTSND